MRNSRFHGCVEFPPSLFMQIRGQVKSLLLDCIFTLICYPKAFYTLHCRILLLFAVVSHWISLILFIRPFTSDDFNWSELYSLTIYLTTRFVILLKKIFCSSLLKLIIILKLIVISFDDCRSRKLFPREERKIDSLSIATWKVNKILSIETFSHKKESLSLFFSLEIPTESFTQSIIHVHNRSLYSPPSATISSLVPLSSSIIDCVLLTTSKEDRKWKR